MALRSVITATVLRIKPLKLNDIVEDCKNLGTISFKISSMRKQSELVGVGCYSASQSVNGYGSYIDLF
jgi:hypothetical protein